MIKKRIEYLDFIKGVAAMLVVLSHTHETPVQYKTLLSFVMLPAFFWVSGYLVKVTQKHIMRDLLYKRAGKLLILYCVYCLILPFASMSNIKVMIKSPVIIIETLKNSVINLLAGKEFWFVSCLIVISVIFVLMIKISKQNDLLLMVTSVTLCIVGIIISKREIIPWHVDTALACQIFYVMGFLMKKYNVIEYIKYEKAMFIVLSFLYCLIVVLAMYRLGAEHVGINVVLNQWGVCYITIPAIIFGVSALILLGKITNGCKFVNYIGAHSLVYFAFASHGMSIFNTLFLKIYGITGIELLVNRYIVNPVICVLGCLVMVLPCLFIDRFMPFLNGQFRMPVPNSEK